MAGKTVPARGRSENEGRGERQGAERDCGTVPPGRRDLLAPGKLDGVVPVLVLYFSHSTLFTIRTQRVPGRMGS